MKPRLLWTCLAFGPVLLHAQEPALLYQSFNLQYYRWQAGLEQANGSTQATYDVMLGLPVVTYRLGAVALTGSLEYNKLTLDGQSDASTGLNRYGMRMNLFPYRPFKLQLDYSRSRSPGLMGIEPVRGEQLGIGAGYRGRWIQDVELIFRRGIARQAGEKETWSSWTLHANQRFGTTEATLQAVRQDFDTTEPMPGWRNTHVNLRTETRFNPRWQLRTTLGGEESQGNRWMDGDATLLGTLGPWSSITTLGARDIHQDSASNRSSIAAQSLTWLKGSFQFASSAALTRTTTGADGRTLGGATYLVGTSYGLWSKWRISANAAVSSQDGIPIAGQASGSRTVSTYHVGLTRGGELPDLVRHSLYLVSDLAFNRRIRDDYPPGYLPGELADQLLQRRLRQQGQFGFSIDAGRTFAKGEPGRLDFAHMSGDLRAGRRLRLMVLGDWRRDEGYGIAGLRQMDRALTGNASLLLGASTSLTGTLGATRMRRDPLPGTIPPASISAPLDSGRSETNYRAIGLNSRFWRIPVGILGTRYEPAVGGASSSQSAHADLDFRQISLRVGFERTHQEGLPTNKRISFSLRRYFDTIALW